MTITLQAVNELIASLESAGELSIKERKYLELAKEFRICSASLDAAIKTGNVLADQNAQLAAENVGLIRSAECLLHEASEVYRAYNKTQLPDGDLVDGQSLQEVWDAINATPATDRIVAGIKADGVAAALESCFDYLDTDCVMDRLDISYEDAEKRTSGAIEFHDAMVNFANQLREGADK
ncbi:hypothetical protein [Klebsiella grimontii]|uniref:hypothetical protein n=1 Tax=Klebsiella grimontii TaxID=2058152 RepID=UPI00292DA516|nr:hypothetical protein [Klebsiella grimontii]